MNWTTIVTASELATCLDRCVVVDCRHDLADPDKGRADYAKGRVPGAFFLHQDSDLAGPRNGRNGRHPLPERETLRRKLESLGLSDGGQLVAYDDIGGVAASRLWWLARWLGHPGAAVLDGGIQAWRAGGHPLSDEQPVPRTGSLSRRESLVTQVDTQSIVVALGTGRQLLADARSPERYRGEIEPLDPVAGHIPGAVNRPIQQNLRPDGRFKPTGMLREEFLALLAGRDPQAVVHHCGSGIAACHNLLAMELAGLPGGAMYPGSLRDPSPRRNRRDKGAG